MTDPTFAQVLELIRTRARNIEARRDLEPTAQDHHANRRIVETLDDLTGRLSRGASMGDPEFLVCTVCLAATYSPAFDPDGNALCTRCCIEANSCKDTPTDVEVRPTFGPPGEDA